MAAPAARIINAAMIQVTASASTVTEPPVVETSAWPLELVGLGVGLEPGELEPGELEPEVVGVG